MRGILRAFDPAGNALDRAKAPYRQKQFGATSAARSGATGVFLRFVRTARHRREQLRQHRRSHDASRSRDAASERRQQILERPASPSKPATSRIASRTTRYWRRSITAFGVQNSRCGSTYGDALNENIEPFGGQVARSRGALLDSEDVMFVASHTSCSVEHVGQRTAVPVRAPQSGCTLARSPVRRAVRRGDQGGPTLEVIGVASVGRQRFTPQPRQRDRYQVARHDQPFPRRAPVQGGIRHRASSRTRTRHCRCTSAAATCLPRPCRRCPVVLPCPPI